MLISLKEALTTANQQGQAIPCFNVFNLDFIDAIISAAEEESAPVILAFNQDMVNEYTMPKLVPMLLAFAEHSSAPVCPHLDHTYDLSFIKSALQEGMRSVMYDGSQFSLKENIKKMNEAAALCEPLGAHLEGEIGSVAYADKAENKKHIKSEKTNLEQAIVMAKESRVDALAVSIGNIHRLETSKIEIEYTLLKELSQSIDLPLVIHGASGIKEEDIRKMALETKVAKFNIATDMRKVWGDTLRVEMEKNKDLYDPMMCARLVKVALKARAKHWIKLLRK